MAAAAAPSSPTDRRTLAEYVLPATALLALVVLWELGVHLFNIAKFVLPPPSLIASEAWAQRAQLPGHTWSTLWETLAGFGLSIVIGFHWTATGLSVAAFPLNFFATRPRLENRSSRV